MCYYVQAHAAGKGHKAALLTWASQQILDETMAETILKIQQKMEMQGSLLSKDTKLFRMKAVQLMCKANVSVLAIDSVSDQLESWAGETLGGRRALMEYSEVHHRIWKDHIKNSLGKLCYPQYATMTDGTPCFASAEGMKLRVISHDWWIKEPLVSVK